MADQNKPEPSKTPNTTFPSPLSPQIKVPQTLQPPADLPIKPATPSITPPSITPNPISPVQSAKPPIVQNTPPKPTVPQFSIPPIQPIKPTPPPQNQTPSLQQSSVVPSVPTTMPLKPTVQPIIPPKPVSPLSTPPVTPPPPQKSEQPTFKSSVRTMQEDIAALKKGQTPAGFKLEKPIEKELGATPAPAPGPTVTPPPKPTEIGLGRLEKAKPLPIVPGLSNTPMPSGPTPPAFVQIPAKSFSPFSTIKRLVFPEIKSGTVLAVTILIIISGAIWFFFLRGPSTPPITSYTPRPSISPKVSPQPTIETIFNISSVKIDITGADLFTKLGGLVDKQILATGDPQLYKLTQPLATTNQIYTFNDWASRATVTIPTDIFSFVDENTSYSTLLIKTDTTFGYGFIVRIKDLPGVDAALKTWETTLPNDLKNLFVLDPTKAASSVFLDNTYQGVAVRYMNFPDATKTIDYAIITVGNEKYLVFTNSKEHMYSILDKLTSEIPVPTP